MTVAGNRGLSLNFSGDFAALDHQRWRIEEQYKRQKQGLQIENFSGKSVEMKNQTFRARASGICLGFFSSLLTDWH